MTGFVIGADRGQVYKFLGIFLRLNNVSNVATRANEEEKKKSDNGNRGEFLLQLR